MLPTALLDFTPVDLAWIDIVGLVLIGGSLVLGIFCGLWWQIIRLVGLVGAVLLARGLSPNLAPLLEEAAPSLGPRYAAGVVWLTVFILGLVAATLLGVVGRKLLETMQLGAFDRVGGALAGVITGSLIHIALVAAFCQLGPEPWVAEQIGGTFSETALSEAGTQWELIVGPDARLELDRLFKQDDGPNANLDEAAKAAKETIKDAAKDAASAAIEAEAPKVK